MRIEWTTGFKDIDVTDDSYRYRKIMGENQLTLKFSLPEFVEFPLGAYTTFENEVYTLYTPQTFKKNSSQDYQYTLSLGGSQELLQNFKVRDTSGRLVFPFTGKPQEHLQLIVDVLNMNDSGWSIGNYVENVEKLISYNHSNCLESLQNISETFNTEWEIKGKTIHLKKVEYNKLAPLGLSYGKGNGFVSGVGRRNDSKQSGFNVLFVQGGDRNIDRSVYGNKNLLLPISKEYTYDGNTYVTDADGLSIVKKNTPITFRKEESLDCSHIYPKRTGEVSQYIINDADKNFYDFTDLTIPAALNFNDYMLNGESLTVLFESGMLSGREFEVNYVHSEKKFQIVPQELDGVTMPDSTFKASVGDKYSVYGMMLPNEYVCDDVSETGSSWEMFKEACKYFFENEDTKFTFQGKLDGIWAKNDWVNIGGKLVIGGYIRFSDTVFQPTGIDIRIVGVKDYINNPYSPDIELANSIQGSTIISELGRVVEGNEVVAQTLQQSVIEYTKRRFRDTQETLAMLQDIDFEEFGDPISPVTIETMALVVGDKSLQFRFVNSTSSPVEVENTFSYNTATKVFSCSTGIIQHLTIGIDDLKPSQDYKFWNMSAFTSAALTDGKKSYYVYARVSKTLTTGGFLLSETSIKIEEETGFYHLLTGILNSEFDGDRSFVRMYGFTEILPGQIKVDKLSSSDGSQYIKLLSDKIEFKGNVNFSSDSPALAQTRENTVKTLEVGGHNLILGSSEYAEFYNMSAEKRDRYFDVEKTYTASVQAISTTDFTGKLQASGVKVSTGTDILGEEDVVLLANKKKRIKVTFLAKINEYSEFVLTLLDSQDVEATGVTFSQPKLELGEIATDWNIAEEDTIKRLNILAENLETALFNFSGTIDDAFKDGVITEAEALSIAKYKNILNNEKGALDSTYTKTYANTDLKGTAKTNLATKKGLYDTAHTNLISSINTAIADSKTTTTESNDVDAKFNAYSLALKAYTEAYEDALTSISNEKASTIQSNAEDNSKNDLAIKLGFDDYDDMIAHAEAGDTIISGGKINTGIIDAVAIIAKYMETDLLRANSVISNNESNKVNINAIAGYPFEVFNSGGTKQLELFEVNGSVQFIYRNKNGDIIWYLGENGMEYAQFTAQSWVETPLKYLGADKIFQFTDFGLTTLEPEPPNIPTTGGSLYYEYVSATNAGTIVEPDLHGKTLVDDLESANLIPDGYYWLYRTTGNNPPTDYMIDMDGNPILVKGDVLNDSNPLYSTWYAVMIRRYQGGVITEQFMWVF